MSERFKGDFGSNEQKEVPEWIKNIKTSFTIYKDQLKNYEKMMGETSWEGSFDKEKREHLTLQLLSLCDSFSEELPEVIALNKTRGSALSMGSSTTLSLPSANYFIPKYKEKYNLNYFGDNKIIPENKNFIGIDALKKKHQDGELSFAAFFDVKANDAYGRLSLRNIKTIIEFCKTLPLSPAAEEAIAAIQDELLEAEAERKKLEEDWKEKLEKRAFNLIDAIEENTGKKLPDKILLNSFSTGDIFLLTRERKLISVPTTEKKILGLRLKNHDFKTAREINQYTTDILIHPWVHAAWISKICDQLPEDKRVQLKKHGIPY